MPLEEAAETSRKDGVSEEIQHQQNVASQAPETPMECSTPEDSTE
jgi:hypothetical protein